jgi:cell pole-organizing protein PopZ
MSQTAKAQEPSMEEILASIRRIIADDEGGKAGRGPEPVPPSPLGTPKVAPTPPPAAAAAPPPPPPPPPAAAATNSQEDVDAVLAEFDAVPLSSAARLDSLQSGASPANADVLDLTEAMTAAPAPKPPSAFRTIDAASDVDFADRPPETPAEPAVRSAEEPRRPLAQATADRSLLSNAAAAAVDSAFNSLAHTVLGHNARTLEDLVKEMLRPMLKAWLDDNLPSLVERIVRAEIERVSRGRG